MREWGLRRGGWLGSGLWRAGLAALALGASAPSPAVDAPAAPGPVWRYGMLASYPPFQLWPAGGWPGGADLDLLQAAAQAAGGRIEPVRYERLDDLLADLRGGRIDLASAMARTPEREAVLSFSPPYARIEQVLVLRARDADVPLVADLAGRRVAVAAGYASEAAVDRMFPLAPRVVVPDIEAGLRALLEGRADLFVEAAPAIVETLDRLGLGGLRIGRRVLLGTGELHLAAAAAGAGRLAPLALAVQALGPGFAQAAVDRWSAVSAVPRPAAADYDAAERALLAGLAPLSVAVVDGQAPFSAAGPDGAPQGLAVDVLAAALQQLGLKVAHWRLMAAAPALQALRSGEVDLALGLPEAASRAQGVGYAGPFIEHPLVLVARRETGLWSLEQMVGRRLAVPLLQVPQTLLAARHPRVEPVPCEAVAACLQRVQQGDADAMVADVVSAASLLAGGGWPQLQIVGTAGDLRHERGVALSPAQRRLAPLLQRALDGLAMTELPALKQRWLERPSPQALSIALLRRAAPWAAALLALLGALWWWHSRGLRAEVARTQAARLEAERAAAAARRFVTFLAHEVRNSLHSVVAGAELLRGEPGVAPAVAEPLGQSARSTLALLNGLLDRERLAAGGLTLDAGPVRLSTLLRGVLQEMAPAAHLAGAELQLQPLADPEPMLELDALRVQQVLRNLLSNAIKYASPGPVTVAAQVQPGAAPGGACGVEITVRDNGPGLTTAQQALLFEPFHSANGNGPGRADSAGLGLALSRDLARAMGGDLRLDCPAAGGVRARFTLRAARSAAPPPAPVAAGRVLVVEDAEVYAMLLQRAFEQAGWEVQVAGSVAAARARLAVQGYELLLTDLHLPDGGAREVLDGAAGRARVRAVMTADLDPQARLLTDAGADAVLPKSADVQDFVARLLDGLQGRLAGAPGA